MDTPVCAATAAQSCAAITKSTPHPRCGPCCSVAPTGRIAAWPQRARTAGISDQVRSDHFIESLHVVVHVGEADQMRLHRLLVFRIRFRLGMEALFQASLDGLEF